MVFFPFDIDKGLVADLGHTIANVEMLNALFDADYSIENLPQSSYSKVISNPNNEDKSFLLYKLGEENFDVDMNINRRLLEIKINSTPPKSKSMIRSRGLDEGQNNDPDDLDLYFRFRITLPPNSLFRQSRITNDVFQSAFSKGEVLNLRINDKRDINYSKLEKLSEGRVWLAFQKIHFYYCGPTADEQVMGSKPYKDCRLIDPSLWSTYLSGLNKMQRELITFHWKEESVKPMKNYSIFVKTIFQSTNILQVLLYIVVAIILGFAGSCFANLISK